MLQRKADFALNKEEKNTLSIFFFTMKGAHYYPFKE